MPQVTNIKAKTGQYEITFRSEDNREATFACSEDLVVEYRLIKGKDLTDKQFTTFKTDVAIDIHCQKAGKYAALAYRSENEIELYLQKRGCERASCDRIIAKLKKTGLIDDRVIAPKIVDSLFYGKRFGKEKIIFELERRGFPPAMVKALIANIPEKDTAANLELLFQHKLASVKGGSAAAAADKMKRYLLTKGYGIHDVIAFVNGRREEFAVLVDEEQEIVRDYSLLRKKYARDNIDEHKLRVKLIQALQRKGYPYSLIIKVLERGR